MHAASTNTVQSLERLKELAENAGYTVRHEWLGGVAGGACEFAGRKWIFVDLSLSVVEQHEQLAGALQDDPTSAHIFPNRATLRTAA